MLVTLLAWIYITFLCWTWGKLLLKIFQPGTFQEQISDNFSITCLTGLGAITIVAGCLSLFIPLGVWWVQLFLFIPPIFYNIKNKNSGFLFAFKNQIKGLNKLSFLLLFSCLLTILVMSTWTIVHPDTLGYHAQTIQWIEKYKAVPGLVHLHVRFGYQGFWFVDNALFDLSFLNVSGLTFLNSTVLAWFFIFMIERINYNFFKRPDKAIGISWIGLLILTFWSYTQVRLTATSSSPDFIAVLFVLAILYILLQNKNKPVSDTDWLQAGFLSLVAVTIKLSVTPILLITAFAVSIFLLTKKWKSFLLMSIIAVLTLAPFILRNIITTGYVAFPSAIVDISNVDWKYDKTLTINEKNYITAYAKKYGVETKDEINAINKMSPVEWIPGWWSQQSIADKTIIILFLISFLTSLFIFKKILRSGVTGISLLIMFAGVIFWFINAPDPRFGFGPILGFVAIIVFLLFDNLKFYFPQKSISLVLLLLTALILAYSGYRFANFFTSKQFLFPAGIKETGFTTYSCDGLKINTAVNNSDFGNIPVPCTDKRCNEFSPRGMKIEDGFKANSTP